MAEADGNRVAYIRKYSYTCPVHLEPIRGDNGELVAFARVERWDFGKVDQVHCICCGAEIELEASNNCWCLRCLSNGCEKCREEDNGGTASRQGEGTPGAPQGEISGGHTED